jgi:hypothetical protein
LRHIKRITQNGVGLTTSVPVVFLVLPITVLFAVFPGFAFLQVQI